MPNPPKERKAIEVLQAVLTEDLAGRASIDRAVHIAVERRSPEVARIILLVLNAATDGRDGFSNELTKPDRERLVRVSAERVLGALEKVRDEYERCIMRQFPSLQRVLRDHRRRFAPRGRPHSLDLVDLEMFEGFCRDLDVEIKNELQRLRLIRGRRGSQKNPNTHRHEARASAEKLVRWVPPAKRAEARTRVTNLLTSPGTRAARIRQVLWERMDLPYAPDTIRKKLSPTRQK